MDLADYLRQLNLSKREFARLMWVSPSSVYRWLNGEVMPSRSHLARMAEVTEGKIDPASFLKGL